MPYEVCAQGTLTANGTEQVLFEIKEPTQLSGYISLSQVEAPDTVVIRQYMKLIDTYVKYAEEVYVGAQLLPLVYITPKMIASSLKVTLEQTAGVMRSFEYKFIKEVAPMPVAPKPHFKI